jgi:hypothetical protein
MHEQPKRRFKPVEEQKVVSNAENAKTNLLIKKQRPEV